VTRLCRRARVVMWNALQPHRGKARDRADLDAGGFGLRRCLCARHIYRGREFVKDKEARLRLGRGAQNEKRPDQL
jgi:hypothetical protein